MAALFQRGHVVDIALAVLALELIAWVSVGAPRLRAPAGLIVANLVAGACLLLALRCALVQADWRWIAVWLTLALVAHGVDLGLRLRRS